MQKYFSEEEKENPHQEEIIRSYGEMLIDHDQLNYLLANTYAPDDNMAINIFITPIIIAIKLVFFTMKEDKEKLSLMQEELYKKLEKLKIDMDYFHALLKKHEAKEKSNAH